MNSLNGFKLTPGSSLAIAKILRRLLADRRMTASELARKSGISRKTLQNWLSGACPASVEQLKDVADILAITVDELCFGVSPPAKNRTDQPSLPLAQGNEIEITKYEVTIRKL